MGIICVKIIFELVVDKNVLFMVMNKFVICVLGLYDRLKYEVS